ncbi:hypothetical protein [Sphingobium sp. CCH11-B1]|jgi:hypothetical protein|uniref:hypothetical protein n=1 Tax=Sphingobium sp. CCH11-B1 TaxID=1768781 RepID=UPI00082AD6ED|nr:hypothetical protein [Sphingobium sp. CCH11-B1]MEA3387716.1 hypothetical protein [Pseudomonadota bacterium]
MDDFISRAELSPVDRTVVRSAAPTQAIKPVTASRASDRADDDTRSAANPAVLVAVDSDVASVAEYVEVHARVSEILADLGNGLMGVDDAAGAIQAMIPRPMVLVPLPPASREDVEHAKAVARRIVERASYAHSAQAHVSRGAVEQITAP